MFFGCDINPIAMRQRYVPASVSDQLGQIAAPATMLRQPRVDLRELKMTNLMKFVKDESGATAIEYGLIAALISVAIIGAATTLGTKLSSTFGAVSGQLK